MNNSHVREFIRRAIERKWCVLPTGNFSGYEKRTLGLGRDLQRYHGVVCIWPIVGRVPLNLALGNAWLSLIRPAPIGGFRVALSHFVSALPKLLRNSRLETNLVQKALGETSPATNQPEGAS